MILESRTVRVEIDPCAGGRIASLRIHGLEVLVARSGDPMAWGCYPMVPFAGRVRRGHFVFGGRAHQLATTMPPHAIHGTTWQREWTPVETGPTRAELEIDLGADWPFPGHARQRISLGAEGLDLELSVHAEREPFPASIGWHPWFRRELERGAPARLSFDARSMYLRDTDGIATGKLVAPTAGPWDDCFTELTGAPQIEWPDALALRIESDARHLVVYDEPAHAVCVEPQTGPPDALNIEPRIVTPEDPLRACCRFTWLDSRPLE